MTEKERIQGEIKILEKKLWFLEEIEEHKDQEMRKAFKDDYGYAPYRNELSWVGFQKGWEASQKNQNNIEEIIDNPTTIPEPKMSEFRQKIFDGIKSVFYDPDYERTHWKMKVNMAVDEVLTHFYDIIPEPQEPICDEKEDGVFDEPSKPMDEVVDRLVKKYQAQKLFNRLIDELGYSIDLCDEIVDLVEDWIPEPQSAVGSQNIDVEFLVDGFNDCVRKMKEMLR